MRRILTAVAVAIAATAAAGEASAQCAPDTGPGGGAFRLGYDEIDLVSAGAPANMYVFYSDRDPSMSNPSGNTAGIFVIPYDLATRRILIVGAGYGNHSVAVSSAALDAAEVDEIARDCLGLGAGTILVTHINQHEHTDHTNNPFFVALIASDWQVEEIVVQWDARFKPGVRTFYDAHPNEVTRVGPSVLCKAVWSVSTDVGSLWVRERFTSHAGGVRCLDTVLDVDANDRILIWGASPGGGCPLSSPPRLWRMDLHGNVLSPPAGWGTD